MGFKFFNSYESVSSGAMLVLADLLLSAGFILTSKTGGLIGYSLKFKLPKAKITRVSVGSATDALQHGVSQSELTDLFGSESAAIFLIEFEAIDPTQLSKPIQDRFQSFPVLTTYFKTNKGFLIQLVPPFDTLSILYQVLLNTLCPKKLYSTQCRVNDLQHHTTGKYTP